MKKVVLKAYNYIGAKYLAPILNQEQKKRPFPQINERATEYAFAIGHMSKLCEGKVLDIGAGGSSWPHLMSTCGFDVKAIDKMDGQWPDSYNRHFKVEHADITTIQTAEKFQFATCLSVLEYIPNHKAAITNIHQLLEINGYLVVTFPYNEGVYDENIYKHPGAGNGQQTNSIMQVFSRNEINSWLEETSFEIIDQKYYKAFTGDLWTMGYRITPCQQTSAAQLHHLTCILLQKKGN